jgi:hypothetical protein
VFDMHTSPADRLLPARPQDAVDRGNAHRYAIARGLELFAVSWAALQLWLCRGSASGAKPGTLGQRQARGVPVTVGDIVALPLLGTYAGPDLQYATCACTTQGQSALQLPLVRASNRRFLIDALSDEEAAGQSGNPVLVRHRRWRIELAGRCRLAIRATVRQFNQPELVIRAAGALDRQFRQQRCWRCCARSDDYNARNPGWLDRRRPGGARASGLRASRASRCCVAS